MGMRRESLGIYLFIFSALLLLSTCSGRGGILNSLKYSLTPYATPLQTTVSTRVLAVAAKTPRPSATPLAARITPVPVGTRTPVPTRASRAYQQDLIDTDPTRNVELAQTALRQEGYRFTLIIVSDTSTGLAGEIYRDLKKRNFRATTGPDEGFETSSYVCHPFCVFVRQEAVNEISTQSWQGVLRHEYRHMVQSANNPAMARDFRPSAAGMFSTFAAFLEACADDGILVAEPAYHSSERMPQLRAVVGQENEGVRQRACVGFKDAYNTLVKSYELTQGEGTFAELFPPYK